MMTGMTMMMGMTEVTDDEGDMGDEVMSDG